MELALFVILVILLVIIWIDGRIARSYLKKAWAREKGYVEMLDQYKVIVLKNEEVIASLLATCDILNKTIDGYRQMRSNG